MGKFNVRRPYGYTELINKISTQLDTAVSLAKQWCTTNFALMNHTHDDLSFGSAPDYNRSVLLLTINSLSKKDIPVWKINVPGYLHAIGSYLDFNQDTLFAFSDSPGKLINTDKFSDGKFTVLTGTASDTENHGGTFWCSVYPGSSTYCTLCGGTVGFHITFTPCLGVPSSIPTNKFVANTGYKIQSGITDDYIIGDDKEYLIVPGSATWKKMFDNNWKSNVSDFL